MELTIIKQFRQDGTLRVETQAYQYIDSNDNVITTQIGFEKIYNRRGKLEYIDNFNGQTKYFYGYRFDAHLDGLTNFYLL